MIVFQNSLRREAIYSALSIFLTVLAPNLLLAQESTPGLFGDWGGARSVLEEHGISPEVIVTTDILGNMSGGIERNDAILGNVDVTATIDTEKAGLWSDGTFFFYVLGNYGDDPTELVGDAQATDNIETYDTAKLYEAWYEHQLADGSVSVLFGLHDYNSEFNALDYAGTLINSSFGIEPDISQVGPSIFATTAAAVRLKFSPSDTSYGLAALYDGVPGDPNDSRGTHVNFAHNDGVFAAGEAGVISEEGAPHYKYGVGGWYHSATFEDFNGHEHSDNSGIYAIGEHCIYAQSDDCTQGLGAFLQIGFTHPDRNQFGNYVGAGFAYTGLFPRRESDVLTFGVAYARNGRDYRRATDETTLAETAFELSYRAVITDFISLQPDIQIVRDPGTSRTVQDAVIGGIRIEVAL